MQPRTLGTKKARYGSVERCIDFEVTPHLLRHTFLTRCFENGLDMKEVQYLAGHKTPELTMRIHLHYQAEERKKRPSARSERCLLHEKPEIYTSLLPHSAAVKCQFCRKTRQFLYRTWYQKLPQKPQIIKSSIFLSLLKSSEKSKPRVKRVV